MLQRENEGGKKREELEEEKDGEDMVEGDNNAWGDAAPCEPNSAGLLQRRTKNWDGKRKCKQELLQSDHRCG